MKFTCNTSELSAACQNVQRAVSMKSSIPSIEGILIEANQGFIKLTGYDLEMGINTEIKAITEREGRVILNARILCDIVRRLPDERVFIECDERQMCYIRSGESEFSIIGTTADEYPELPSVTGGYPVILEQGIIKNMIRQTIFAVAVIDNKPVHMGVRFELEKGQLRLIAVDGYRLAMRTEAVEYDGEPLQFVVPAKTLNEVVKLMSEDDKTISISVGKRHIVFEIDAYSIVSRLLEGDFLDYQAAIPKSGSTTVELETQTLIESIERTSLIFTDRLKSPIRCIFGEDEVKISCVTSLGRSFDRLHAAIQGERVEIGFNNKYLFDALKATESERIIVSLNGPLSPITIVPTEGEGFLFLVLPVRLKNDM